MCGFDDDGLGAEEMGVILGITDEMEEEAKSQLIDNGPEDVTPDHLENEGFLPEDD